MELFMARSLAGHDRGKFYVVLGEDGNDWMVVDGVSRTMDEPKRKRRKHLQPIMHFPKEVVQQAASYERWTNEHVRAIIRRYLDCQKQM